MTSFDSRKDELVNKHLAEVIEQSVARLVNNFQIPENESNMLRGFVAAYRQFHAFYNGELPKQLNEG